MRAYTGNIESMSSSRRIAWMIGTWLLFLVIYSAISLSLKRGSEPLNTLGNLVQCVLPLLANAGLLLNAGTPKWRQNLFWMLMALSCTLWMIGQFQWTYYEIYLHKPVPDLNGGDILFFLRGIPMMAALALRPHLRRGEIQLRFGYLDFVLLFVWWTYVYAFVVLPWLYASPAVEQYNYNYNLLANLQNMIILAALGALWLGSRGTWRVVYANLFGASAAYLLSSLTINVAIASRRYYTGSLYDIPLVSSFLWYAFAGAIAYQYRDKLDAPSESTSGTPLPVRSPISIGTSWMLLASRLRTPRSMSGSGPQALPWPR